MGIVSTIRSTVERTFSSNSSNGSVDQTSSDQSSSDPGPSLTATGNLKYGSAWKTYLKGQVTLDGVETSLDSNKWAVTDTDRVLFNLDDAIYEIDPAKLPYIKRNAGSGAHYGAERVGMIERSLKSNEIDEVQDTVDQITDSLVNLESMSESIDKSRIDADEFKREFVGERNLDDASDRVRRLIASQIDVESTYLNSLDSFYSNLREFIREEYDSVADEMAKQVLKAEFKLENPSQMEAQYKGNNVANPFVSSSVKYRDGEYVIDRERLEEIEDESERRKAIESAEDLKNKLEEKGEDKDGIERMKERLEDGKAVVSDINKEAERVLNSADYVKWDDVDDTQFMDWLQDKYGARLEDDYQGEVLQIYRFAKDQTERRFAPAD